MKQVSGDGLRQTGVLLLSVAIPLAVGAAGAIFTSDAIPTWYATLRKPEWTPPSWLFGPVWTALYAAMGVAAWLIWRIGQRYQESRGAVRAALWMYAAQLALNGIWSPIFFGARQPGLALVVIAVLLVLIVETMRRFVLLRPTAALL
ncbi:MAG: TspO/MBR family protein, partial [Dehalococcoidia bacterium]